MTQYFKTSFSVGGLRDHPHWKMKITYLILLRRVSLRVRRVYSIFVAQKAQLRLAEFSPERCCDLNARKPIMSTFAPTPVTNLQHN